MEAGSDNTAQERKQGTQKDNMAAIIAPVFVVALCVIVLVIAFIIYRFRKVGQPDQMAIAERSVGNSPYSRSG